MGRQRKFTVIEGGKVKPFAVRRNVMFAAYVIGAALGMGVAFRFLPPSLPAFPSHSASATDRTPPAMDIRVIDGDTIEDRTNGIKYRLANIDTPETGDRARCAAERELGDLATTAARTLIANAHGLEVLPIGRIDSYGRTIAHVKVDGRDLGETLVGCQLARPWSGRREPWCDSRGNLIR